MYCPLRFGFAPLHLPRGSNDLIFPAYKVPKKRYTLHCCKINELRRGTFLQYAKKSYKARFLLQMPLKNLTDPPRRRLVGVGRAYQLLLETMGGYNVPA